MKLLRAATLTVADLARAIGNYQTYFDYAVVEQGALPADLAVSWDAPASEGLAYAILKPASGADIYLRLIEQPPVPGYTALRSYGWNAIEICVQDVLAANARMEGSPFEIIGPPREIDGLPAIYPMQVKGPDEEIVYLTQIRDDLPAFDLPRAAAPIDKLFILVLGCRDMKASLDWMVRHCGLAIGRDEMEIVYTMLAKAYGTPMEELHKISTMIHGRDVFLELDQYPGAAIERPRHPGMLVPGCAVGTLWHPDFDALPGPWITPPVRREGPIYQGKRAATMKDPDGALIEIVEA
jgi:catechol 2,3-dioxygenase-like lactoylglutathione lyase family enzyme